MTDTPEPQAAPDSPVFVPQQTGSPAPPPSADAAPVSPPPTSSAPPPAADAVIHVQAPPKAIASDGVTAGGPAPNSTPRPGAGLPLVGGAPMSTRAGMRAGGLNIAFLVSGIVGVIILVLLIILVIHLL